MITRDKNKIINIITLGCSKNLVDSEFLSCQLEAHDVSVVHNNENSEADIVIINTCGFINDAKEESVDTILHYVNAKKTESIRKLIVIGCLSQRYKEDLVKEISEVDLFLGTEEHQKLLESLGYSYNPNLIGERTITTPSHYSYLKISEGCNRQCSFCAIPSIRGKYKSKSVEELIRETRFLVSKGVKEIMLIAQDLTYYGMDMNQKKALENIVGSISDINGLDWIRLHYAYPVNFPKGLITLMKERSNICKYLDIPFQHISDTVLRNMRRGNTKESTYSLIDYIKKNVPDITLRTTLLVGHPGEMEKDFAELKQFVTDVRFDRLGVFTYSEEEGTYAAAKYNDIIPEDIKKERAAEIMELQQQISYEKNEQLIGKILKVIIDREEAEFFVGRTEGDSPEVDNEVLVRKGKQLVTGEFYNVKIIEADCFDLIGEIT